MNNFFEFARSSQQNSTSYFEKAGDFLLTPTRYLFAGHRFAVLGKGKDKIAYELKSDVSNFARIISVIGLIFAPLGLLFKAIGLLTSEKTRTAYFDKYTVVAVSQNEPDRLHSIYQQALANPNLTSDLIQAVAVEPTDYVQTYLSFTADNIAFNSFGECACQDGAFNRLVNSRRSKIEKELVSDLSSKLKKDQTVTLLSLGSGRLLEEFIILGKLVRQGFNNFFFILIDPHISTLAEFDRFCKALQHAGIMVKIEHYDYAVDYFETASNTRMDAILGIDLDFRDSYKLTAKQSEFVAKLNPSLAERETKSQNELSKPLLVEEPKSESLDSLLPLVPVLPPVPFLELGPTVPTRSIVDDLKDLQKYLKNDGKMYVAAGKTYFTVKANESFSAKMRD